VRRSVAFPEDLYEQLRAEAFHRRVSVNQLIMDRMRPVEKKVDEAEMKRLAREDLRFFRKMGEKIKREFGEVDVVKVIREERDRDNA